MLLASRWTYATAHFCNFAPFLRFPSWHWHHSLLFRGTWISLQSLHSLSTRQGLAQPSSVSCSGTFPHVVLLQLCHLSSIHPCARNRRAWTRSKPNWCSTVSESVAVHPRTRDPCVRRTSSTVPPSERGLVVWLTIGYFPLLVVLHRVYVCVCMYERVECVG